MTVTTVHPSQFSKNIITEHSLIHINSLFKMLIVAIVSFSFCLNLISSLPGLAIHFKTPMDLIY